MADGNPLTFGLSREILGDLRQVFRRHPGIDRVLIFGSRAKGTHKDGSDVDLAVIAPTLSDEAYTRLWNEIDRLPMVFKVELLHWDTLANARLKRSALWSGQQLFPAVVPLSLADIFARLVDNAFGHLEKGLAEFDAEINFSVQHFCGGVELIVKACVLSRDWKLVVEEPGAADWAKLCAGEQKTVGLEDAARRLATPLGSPIPAAALRAFKGLSIHRNRLTHFFHPTLNQPSVRQQVGRSLLVAWYHLRTLLRHADWSDIFEPASPRIADIERRQAGLRGYFQAVFDSQVKSRPDAHTLVDCPACGFRALDKNTGQACLGALCQVCEYAEPSHRAIKEGEEPAPAGR
jgi:proline iminopeptidase